MYKRITSLALVFLMVLSMFAVEVPAFAASGKTTSLKLTADKTEAEPGDVITFTVTMGAVEELAALGFDLRIPSGLTLVSGSGTITEGLMTTMAAANIMFTESSKIFMAAACNYTSSADTVLMTFQCRVDDGASGNKTVELGLVDDDPDNCLNLDYDNIAVTFTPENINVTEQTNPAKPSISVTGTYTYTGSEQTATVTGYDADTMNISGNTGTNAGPYTVSVTSKTGTWADGSTNAVTAEWTIGKATPSYTVPTGLAGTKGNALSTVSLTPGWTWKTPDTVMNAEGNQTFKAVFTPADTANYNIVEADVTVNVKEPVKVTVSGTVTSFRSETENVTVQLFAGSQSEAAYTVVVTGNSASYSIADVLAGTYTMKVSKANHVAREYTVTVAEDNVTQNAKIHLLGDIDGDGIVNTTDVGRVNGHAKGIKVLTGYALSCADVENSDGSSTVNINDVGKLNAYVKGLETL